MQFLAWFPASPTLINLSYNSPTQDKLLNISSVVIDVCWQIALK